MFRFSVPRALLATLLAFNICIGLAGLPSVLDSAAHVTSIHLADDGPPMPTPH
jgi:hypothetical protein